MTELMKKTANLVVNVLLVVLVLSAVLVLLGRLSPNRQLPVVGALQVLVVDGGSMEPSIKLGSVILVRATDPAAIQVGDVVSFRPPTRRGSTSSPAIATHRVIEARRERVYGEHGTISFRTKGDANEEPDMQAISGASVIGKVVASLPYAGYVVRFGQTPAGLTALILVPALVLVGAGVRDLVGKSRARRNSAGA